MFLKKFIIIFLFYVFHVYSASASGVSLMAEEIVPPKEVTAPSTTNDGVDHVAFSHISQAVEPITHVGVVHYVDKRGDDSWPGTSDRPKRTLTAGAIGLLPGDTLMVAGGTYDVHEGFNVHLSGTLLHPITIKPFSKLKQVLLTGEKSCLVRIEDSAYLRFEGFKLTAIQSSTSSNSTHGIQIKRSHHISLIDNVVSKCGGNGIGTMHCDFITILGNKVSECGFTSPWQCSGISMYQCRNYNGDPGIHNLIKGNLSTENENRIPNTHGVLTDGNGIIIDDGRNEQGNGPHTPYLGRTLITENVCLNNGGGGIHIYQSDRVDVIENICAGNGRRIKKSADLSLFKASDVLLSANFTDNNSIKQEMRIEKSDAVTVSGNFFRNEPFLFDLEADSSFSYRNLSP